MMGRTWLRAVAVCGTLALWASPSAADDIIPALTLQTGVTYTRSPGNDSDDYFVAATPSVSYFLEGDRTLAIFRYAFTGSLNSVLPNGIANELSALASYDVAPRTRLLFGAGALQALIGNYLVVRRSAATQFGGLPPLNTSLLTVSVTQGLSHEITPVVRLIQGVTGTYVTSLDPDVQLRNYLATASVGVARSWEFDALGGDLSFQYARTFLPPLPTLQIMTVAAGPTWDHDFTPNLSMSAGLSAQLIFSPDPKTTPQIGPAAVGTLFYASQGSGIGLELLYGVQPNVLLGQLLRSEQATLRGFTPLSERFNVVLGLSGGYLHGENVDLGGGGRFNNTFDAVLHDADITWAATDSLAVFVRYQFIGQGKADGFGGSPAIVRHGAILGMDLFGARPPPRSRLPQGKFPQRVDGADGPQLARPGGAGPGAPGGPGGSSQFR